MRGKALSLVVALVASLAIAATPTAPASAATTQKRCALPKPGEPLPTAKPAQVAIDQKAVDAALLYAETHLRTSVKIFRNNCKIGEGLLDPVTENVPMELFSSTKSVVSLVTGIAYDQGKIDLDAPIGRYLPKGLGDAAHRRITVRHLLTETSGLDQAILSEFATILLDPDVSQQAMALPITHKPGTHFAYSQRTPDLLAYVVQRAVGQDFQAYAQKMLFDPIGIPRSSYVWLRDRKGNTYGYANLFMPTKQFAKLGLLAQNDGKWGRKRVVSSRYLTAASTPTKTNECYGFLFWVNGGSSCTSADIPSAQTVQSELITSAPDDLYAMVGALQQNNFIIPSLDMTVTWTGVLGDTSLNLAGILSASGPGSDLYHNFFRLLMRGVKDVKVPDPGPFKTPPLQLDINPKNYLSLSVLLSGLVPNKHCNLIYCRTP